MYDPRPTSTEKCFAYVVADHLNCVTLDSWPAQPRIAELLGCHSIKTPQRIARGLERLGFLTIKHSRKNRIRYAPVFGPGEERNPAPVAGHLAADTPDTNVQESSLGIPFKSCSTEEAADRATTLQTFRRSYDSRKRGAIEMRITEMLGRDGVEILSKLSSFDDGIVDRLCRSCAEGSLGERELVAARFAAEQM
jgi:hypothetical protein